MNPRFQNVLKGVAQKTPPIWFMRQAGRYHKHYQALRKNHGFMELCKQPSLACEVAMGPIEDFDFDVAILFSDLLFPLEALGMGLSYDPSPKLGWHLSESSIARLRSWREAVDGVAFQKEAMQLTRKALPSSKSLIGFVGGPWTLFTYAVEGEHKGNLIAAKTQFALYHKFCESLLPLLEANIALQLEGGAEVVMIFDTAAGELSPAVFHSEVQPHLTRLAQKYSGRLGYYSKGTSAAHIEELRQHTHWAGFGLDHRVDLTRELLVQPHGFLQGNFDQTLLFCKPDEFRHRLDQYLKPFQILTPEQRRAWVSGLGHGVLPETPEENVRHFVRHVREVFA
jgi:uroporphyrinogen decarboxylase